MKAIFPKGNIFKLAVGKLPCIIYFEFNHAVKAQSNPCSIFSTMVGATLRAAAPHQKSRRKHAIGTKNEGRPVLIQKVSVEYGFEKILNRGCSVFNASADMLFSPTHGNVAGRLSH